MFREQNEADCHDGDWLPRDLVGELAPANARFHKPTVVALQRSRQEVSPGTELFFSPWESHSYLTPVSLDKLLEQKFGAKGPGIAVAAAAIRDHNASHNATLRIEERIFPLQNALKDPLQARVLRLSEDAISSQLAELQRQLKESLTSVCATDEQLAEFYLDNRHFFSFETPTIQRFWYGTRYQEKTVLKDGNPITSSHHVDCLRSGESQPSMRERLKIFIDRLSGR
jgi:hypothetical protein